MTETVTNKLYIYTRSVILLILLVLTINDCRFGFYNMGIIWTLDTNK